MDFYCFGIFFKGAGERESVGLLLVRLIHGVRDRTRVGYKKPRTLLLFLPQDFLFIRESP